MIYSETRIFIKISPSNHKASLNIDFSLTFSILFVTVLQRIMNLLHMDSHINLQSLRWPFYTRFSVPTVLGTPTSLTVQNTALSSLRGNITQLIQSSEVTRSHQIDIRYDYNYFGKTHLLLDAIKLCFVLFYLFSIKMFIICQHNLPLADIQHLPW